jgi:microcystin-dependent protein
MAAASVTNTFTSLTPAVGSQVNRNFDDLVDFANDNTTHRDGSKPFTGEQSMGSFKLTNVASGTSANDAATVGQLAGTLPTGFMVMYGAAVSPSVSWIVCNGAAISRSSYSDLFAVIGISFGGGDGATTFNVPDLQNRVPYGGTVGVQGGSNDAVTVSHTHANTFSAAAVGNHNHYSYIRTNGSDYFPIVSSGTRARPSGPSASIDTSLPTSFAGGHSHTISGSITEAGTSGTDLNRPAFTGVQFLIKSGL